MKILFAVLSVAVALSSALPARADDEHERDLVSPKFIVFDKGIPPVQQAAQILAARRFDTFWSTGDEKLLHDALSPNFQDRTPPPGRAQGIAGPLGAWREFHTAVPDVHCDVEQMLVVGDRVVTHLHFIGHFTGSFKELKGRGQKVDFIATDIYRVTDGKITDNWHLEDNLTFLTQIGAIKP